MADSMDAEQGGSNGAILLIAGVLGILIALVTVPSLFLLLAAVIAIGAMGAAVVSKSSSSTERSHTVQLQQLPRSASHDSDVPSRSAQPRTQEADSSPSSGTDTAAASKAAAMADAQGPIPNDQPPVARSSDTAAARGPEQQQQQQQQQPPAAPRPPAGNSNVTASDESASNTVVSGYSKHTSSHTSSSSSTYTSTAPGRAPINDSTSTKTKSGSSSMTVQPPTVVSAEAKPDGEARSVTSQQTSKPAGVAQAPPGAGKAGGAAILARLKAQRAQQAQKVKAAVQPEVTVLYASQTGTAQEVARSIQAASQEHNIKSKVMSCNELGWENLSAEKTPIIVLVASSTGDGDAPDNAAKFYATMKRRSQEKGQLKGISHTVLGLGDSNYTRFAHVPRTFRTRLADLGSTPFYKAVDGDEVDGLEPIIDDWVDGLWPALLQELASRMPSKQGEEAQQNGVTHSTAAEAQGEGPRKLEGVPPLPACRVRLLWENDADKASKVAQAEKAHPTAEEVAHRDSTGHYSPEEPFWATVAEAALMTAADSDRRVLHMGVEIGGSGMQYRPGDSIGVLPQNDEALVDRLLQRLGADGSCVFSVAPADGNGGSDTGSHLLEHLQWPCTLRHALQRGCDLTGTPRKSLLRLLAEYCADAGEKQQLLHLCSRGGRDGYNIRIRDGQPSLLDLLQEFPSCSPPLDALLDTLPALTPRLYSIASSPLQQPDQVDVAFSVVRMSTRYGTKKGVATTWLDRLTQPLHDGASAALGAQPPRVAVYLRSGGAFHPPADIASPIILIGPGTGVAPFRAGCKIKFMAVPSRGFLQHRRQQQAAADAGAAGEAWLFFGCRQEQEDFLYRQDLEAFKADGTLTQLHMAFSRAQAEKVYVQHVMRQHGPALQKLIAQQGAHVYVCGDGAQMAKDVHATLIDILAEHGGQTSEEAASQLAQLATQQRYVRDIWS